MHSFYNSDLFSIYNYYICCKYVSIFTQCFENYILVFLILKLLFQHIYFYIFLRITPTLWNNYAIKSLKLKL